MRESAFRKFLENDAAISSKDKAVNSRVTKAVNVEKIYNVDLDGIVIDDRSTYDLLIRIKPNDVHGVKQNAVRKYYAFVNGADFPSLRNFER
ncbi:MAG: hypothetical protein PHV56_01795 [Clostridia bacterium]|nr:hypothetical protein [Clostridia bacterium]